MQLFSIYIFIYLIVDKIYLKSYLFSTWCN